MSTTFNPHVDLSWSGSARSVRRFGDNWEPLRRLYFLDFPLLLLSVGLLTWVFPTDTMLVVSSSVGAFVGFYSLWEVVVRRRPMLAEFLRVNLPEMVSTIAILALLYNSLVTEAGLWVHLLAVRGAILFSAFLWICFKMPALALKHPPQKGAFLP